MKQKLLNMFTLKVWMLLIMTLGGIHGATADVFTRISSINELADGDKIIFVNQAETHACGTTQNTNNRKPVSITVTDHSYTYLVNDNVQVFTVKINSGKYGFHTGDGYIYSASNSSNYLKTNTTGISTTPSGTSAWSLSISSYVITATNVSNKEYYLAFNSTTYFSQYKTGQSKPYIYKKSNTPVTSVSFNKTATTLEVGDTETLTATVTPDNADNKNVTWSSSAESVATVSYDGVVTAIAPGTATITATTEDGSYTATCEVTVNASSKAIVNITGFTADATTLIKGTTTTTTITNDQAGWTSAYTYTSSDESVATVNASGVITAVAKGTAAITATLNVDSNDENYKEGSTTSMSIEITVNNPSHTATFSSNGSTFDTPVTVEEGEAITFPATNPTYINGYSFVGWAEATIDGTTQTAPSFVTSATMGENDVTYYAVFAQVTQGNLTTVTDVLTRTTTGVTGQSYSNWSGKTATSSAVYAGNSAGSYESIQIRSDNNNSGIITTASGGRATKVSVEWNSNTGSERTITIYGKSTAYSSPGNLYNVDGNYGYTLGEIKNGTTELTLTGNYPYIGIRSKSGALYLTSISITWTNGTPDTYSNYCTTVSALPIPVITMSDVTMDFGETGKSVAPTATIGEEAYSGAFTYSVDAEGLTVGADGSLTSSTPGTYTVTATIAGTETYQTASATCTVIVRKQPTMPATSEQTVAYGETYTLSLEGADCGDVTLTSSNTDVATVDGLTATPVSVGTTTITVNAAADATHTAGTTSFTLTVEQPSPNTTVVGDFVHVTSNNDVTDGKYLIVYEYGPVAFNGSLETLDVAENKISIDHSNNAIINTAAMSAASFTITAVDGGYTIKSASGYYIGQTSNANGLASSTETPYTNTISIDDNGNADISSAGAYLRYNKESGQNRFRYYASGQQPIMLYKAGDTGSESVTLNSAGYLAYASANPMDFSTATGFSAWQITAIEGTTITFGRITGSIAGGQGVLLKGKANATISIPLKESTTKLTGNKLAATLAPTYFADETIYGLSGNQFYLNEPCTLKANRAYIPASEVPAQAQGAKGFTLVFADQETGITETQDATLQPAATIYNLAGQRMSHPQRGINIIGGRKVVVK